MTKSVWLAEAAPSLGDSSLKVGVNLRQGLPSRGPWLIVGLSGLQMF